MLNACQYTTVDRLMPSQRARISTSFSSKANLPRMVKRDEFHGEQWSCSCLIRGGPSLLLAILLSLGIS